MSSLLRRIERRKGVALWANAKVVEKISDPVPRRKIKKGTYGRRIVKRVVGSAQTHELHATKGWRTYAS